MNNKKRNKKNYSITFTDKEIKKQRLKARQLKNSKWWRKKKERGICYYCGKKISSGEFTMDHIIPLSKGGKSIKSNIVLACKNCNSNKKNFLPTEWKEYLLIINSLDLDKK